jgi:adenine specific DNA methylase Mod
MNGKSEDIIKNKVKELKKIFPEVITEGKVDFEQLKATLGEEINTDNERYVLNWAGKSEAFRVLQQPTTATLAPAPKESINFDTTENIFIEGENLEVLKILQKSYYGKIKMIYIDPPYNTGNDSFIYPDKFAESKEEYLKQIGEKDEEGYLLKEGLFRKNSKENGQFHSVWLSMMYPRLFLARNLLRDDGVIFISIDDNEVHNLRMVMNEIFGEENFVACVADINNPKGRSDDKYIATAHEYVLIYKKMEIQFSGWEPEENITRRYNKVDEKNIKRASLIYLGLLSMPARFPFSNLKPNFVPMMTLSRIPLNARPSSSSFLKGPYISAVSKKLHPSSMARCMVSMDSLSSAGPYDWLMPMQPSPMAGTSKPWLPSLRLLKVMIIPPG